MAIPLKVFLPIFSALCLFMFTACDFLVDRIGGAYTKQPEDLEKGLSADARKFMETSLDAIKEHRYIDYHLHILGNGTSGSGAWVNPEKFKLRPGLKSFRSWLGTKIYLSAANIKDMTKLDQQYIDRLIRLLRNMGIKGEYHILAFDYYHNPDGTTNHEKSEFHVPNEYVYNLSKKYPDLLVPVVSVHPYRKDAVSELTKWAEKGVRFVKWLPNAQGIDALDSKTDAYYDIMKKYNMILLTHVGEEQAVEAHDDQEMGNPLRFRKPLGAGVKVIMAHCASLGFNIDLDHPGSGKKNSFDLFMRLMKEKKYQGLLFGEISAMTQFNRVPGPILKLMEDDTFKDRLVNGSDYPLPSINFIYQTGKFVKYKMLRKDEQKYLQEIYDYNPLLFDLVLKLNLHNPNTDNRLIPPEIFTRDLLL